MSTASHCAFADESYTDHRFRSIAVVTLPSASSISHSVQFEGDLESSSLAEFKWSKLRQARERFAAFKFIDRTINAACTGQLRVDVLIWDTEDSRHKIQGRDDIANLQRMYFHLFRNVLSARWPTGSTWQLHPDENTAMDWMSVQDRLQTAAASLSVQQTLDQLSSFQIALRREFKILELSGVCSGSQPICQVADLFAGLGAFSHSEYTSYVAWLAEHQGQAMLLPSSEEEVPQPSRLSNSDRERFAVVKYFDDMCKRKKMRIGLKPSRGFRTRDPRQPLNFWLYEPQCWHDKAPTHFVNRMRSNPG